MSSRKLHRPPGTSGLKITGEGIGRDQRRAGGMVGISLGPWGIWGRCPRLSGSHPSPQRGRGVAPLSIEGRGVGLMVQKGRGKGRMGW